MFLSAQTLTAPGQTIGKGSSRSSLHRGEKSSTGVKTSHLAELQNFTVWGCFTAFESASTDDDVHQVFVQSTTLMMIADQFEMILQSELRQVFRGFRVKAKVIRNLNPLAAESDDKVGVVAGIW